MGLYVIFFSQFYFSEVVVHAVDKQEAFSTEKQLSKTTKLIFGWFTSTRGVYQNKLSSIEDFFVISVGLMKDH